MLVSTLPQIYMLDVDFGTSLSFMSRRDGPVHTDDLGDIPTLAQLIGGNIRDMRGRLEWTQDEFASRIADCGLSLAPGSIANIEKGARTPDLGELIVIAMALGCHLDSLLMGRSLVRVAEEAVMSPELISHVVARSGISPLEDSPATLGQVRSIEDDAFEDVSVDHLQTPEVVRWMQETLARLEAMLKMPRSPMEKHPAATMDIQIKEELIRRAEAITNDDVNFRRHWIRGSELERRIAKKLGVSVVDLHALDIELWDQHVAEERDQRVQFLVQHTGTSQPRRTMQALRGHMTRDMTDELNIYLGIRTTIMKKAEELDITIDVAAQIPPDTEGDDWWTPIERSKPEWSVPEPRRRAALRRINSRFTSLGMPVEFEETS